MRRLTASALALALAPATAVAHTEVAPAGAGDLVVLGFVALAAWLYARGVVAVWRAASPDRGLARREAGAFAAGLVVVAAAAGGPLEAATRESFAAHMVQHELLMTVAAPLCVLGRPLAAWAWALGARAAPTAARLRAPSFRVPWRVLTSPAGASLVQIALLWAWHVPRFFDAAVGDAALHGLQHATLFAASLAFWWAALGRSPAQGIGWLFVTMIATGALGALLAFAPVPLYAVYAPAGAADIADALADQQLAGLVMWIPGGTVYAAAALILSGRLLRRERARSARALLR